MGMFFETRAKPVQTSEGEGAALLNDLLVFLRRFVAFPSDASAIATVLWAAHTHTMDAWESTPRLAFVSPEPGSGKSRALEILELLVPRPVVAVNVSAAYLIRKVTDPIGRPTILHDEIDTVFGPKVKRDVEETRGLLNAGHRKGAVTGRCRVAGKSIETEEIEAYCAVALAGLGDLPDTIATRSITVRMRRRAPDERIEPYRRRIHGAEGAVLCERLSRWMRPREAVLSNLRPDLPAGVEDRAADVWEPLIAIADMAGSEWSRLARESALAHVKDERHTAPSLGERLLSDIRDAFEDATLMTSADLLAALNGRDEAPWGDLRGKPLDTRGLARLLRPYGITSCDLRTAAGTLKGYRRDALWDAWKRYLPPISQAGATGATSAT